MINDDNIYDPTIYTDYYDIPADVKKKLFTEYLSGHPDDKRTLNYIKFISALSIGIVLVLLITSLVLSIIFGISLVLIIMTGVTMLSVVWLIVFMLKSEKIRVSVLRRYSSWLLKEKNIIATLKIDIEKE